MRAEIRKGDRIIMFTDGIIESIDEEKNLFGMDRLKKIALQTLDATAEEAVHEIIRQTEKFTGGLNADDDMTIIAIDILA